MYLLKLDMEKKNWEIDRKSEKIILYRVILEKMFSVWVSWEILYSGSLQWSENEWDYFYPTLRAGAAVSKVNNYGDSVLRRSPKRTQTQSLVRIHTHIPVRIDTLRFDFLFLKLN